MTSIRPQHSTDNPRLSAALAYAKRRWRVLPCYGIRDGQCTCGQSDGDSPGKHPLFRGSFKHATTDSERIRQWWIAHPDANVAIATGAASGFIVVDVDPRHGGHLTLADLEAQHGKLPETAVSFTGGGGRIIFSNIPMDPSGLAPVSSALASTSRQMGGTLSLLRAAMPAVEIMNGRSPATRIRCP